MKIPFAVFADYVNATADGKVNVIGMFDEIRSAKEQRAHQFFLLYRVEASRDEVLKPVDLVARLEYPDGSEAFRFNSQLQFAGAGKSPPETVFRANVTICIQGLRLAQEGVYHMGLSFAGTEVHRVPLPVVFAKADQK